MKVPPKQIQPTRQCKRGSRDWIGLETSLWTIIGMSLLLLVVQGMRWGWSELWWTPDQAGQRWFRQAKYVEAANSFQDVNWQATAWYRAGEFERAALAWGNLETPMAQFNAGNAWVLLGKYQVAVACYERALSSQPNWLEAKENRDLALARAKRMERTGADLGDQQIGADQVVFDREANNEGRDTEIESGQPLSDAAIQELWLRRVQTRPADFLRSKFAHQQALRQSPGESPP